MADTIITTPEETSIVLEGDGACFIGDNTVKKESLLTPMPLYLLDSDLTEVFDFGGVIKIINLSGVYVGATKAACKTFIDNCESLIQGQQDLERGYPLDFVDDYRGTVKVKVADFESTKEAGEPLIVRWSLKLMQASPNA